MGLFRRRHKSAGPVIATEHPDIVEADFKSALAASREATMTTVDRLYALYSAVRYVVEAGLPGPFVECGVWKGGSVMMMALTLKSLGVTDRDIYLFDTFEGMTAPDEKDVDYRGTKAQALLDRASRDQNLFWAYSPLEEVRRNLAKTGYPMERFKLIQGDVLKTVPGQAPDQMALLRLDTDWYESTKHELEQLFPRLIRRGVLIVDDYGYYQGARQAVDEFLAKQSDNYLMTRLDYTGRLLVKA